MASPEIEHLALWTYIFSKHVFWVFSVNWVYRVWCYTVCLRRVKGHNQNVIHSICGFKVPQLMLYSALYPHQACWIAFPNSDVSFYLRHSHFNKLPMYQRISLPSLEILVLSKDFGKAVILPSSGVDNSVTVNASGEEFLIYLPRDDESLNGFIFQPLI